MATNFIINNGLYPIWIQPGNQCKYKFEVLNLENSFLRFTAVDKNDSDKVLAQATFTLNMLRKG